MRESLEGRLIFGRTTRIRPLAPGPHAGSYRREAHRLERPDGAVLEGWSSAPVNGRAARVLLYFGGRNENVTWAPDMASFKPGWAIHAFNYRGFGGSTARACERHAKADALALLDFVASREPQAELAIAGRSLGTAIALWLAREARPGRLVLLYFGGRKENVAWAPDMASFNPGWAVYAFNYRGIGDSTGRASERRAKDDARAILDFATDREWTATLAIVGRSLGTAIALSVAREAKPQRLVLMSPFESVPGTLRTRPLGRIGARLVTQRFACADLAAAHRGEALVLLAENDDAVPHEQSRRLCERLPHPPVLRTITGTTHQSLPRSTGAQAAIAAYLPSTFIPRSA